MGIYPAWRKLVAIIAVAAAILCGCTRPPLSERADTGKEVKNVVVKPGMEVATLGGGCFWCVEAIYDQLDGVESVTSGYAGGSVNNPSYEAVCQGNTGHAESVNIVFDPKKLSYHDLLGVFFKVHDPTTLNQQGADHGTQYRSVIFYRNEEQHKVAEEVIKEITDAKIYDGKIVTQVVPYSNFFSAEDYHQHYYERNPYQGYCMMVISPKVDKFKKLFHSRLKTQTANP